MEGVGTLPPLTYLGDGLRQTMVSGSPFVPVAVGMAILAGWLVVCLGISARFFRWAQRRARGPVAAPDNEPPAGPAGPRDGPPNAWRIAHVSDPAPRGGLAR
jgi:hypothetical protein